MKHSKISDVITLGIDKLRYAFPQISISGNNLSITKIKCFAVAQAKTKPFSIYPIKFEFESCETRISMLPFELVAVPQPDTKIENNTITENEVYIASCDFICDISCISGLVNIQGYATPLFYHVVAPKAFFIIEYNIT